MFILKDGKYMDNDIMREFIKDNVLSTMESCKLLGVSRQTFNQYIKDEKAIPAKVIANGMLFYKDDIIDLADEKYKRRNARNKRMMTQICGDGSTEKSINYLKENIEDKDDVLSVKIYFERNDAIVDGYYNVDGSDEIIDKLVRVSAPHAVVTLKGDKELWVDGLLCGYGGEGPHGSERFLKYLDVPDNEINKLFSAAVIEYYREDGIWKGECFKSRREQENQENDEYGIGRIFMFNGNLVLIQDDCRQWDSDPVGFLREFQSFVSKPASVTIYSRKEALSSGHYYASIGNSNCYQIVIKDVAGREIWMQKLINENKPISKQPELVEVLEMNGIKISKKEKYFELFKILLSSKVRIDDKTVFDVLHSR